MLGNLLLWIIIVISSVFTLFWILVYVFLQSPSHTSKKFTLKNYPVVSIAVPAYNEETTIKATLQSLISLDYPSDKLEIIVVDDGSIDLTSEKVIKFMKENPNNNVIFLRNPVNRGKAFSLNKALNYAKGEYFAVLDADTKVNKNTLKNLISTYEYYKNHNIGAIISRIKVWNITNWVTLLQKYEYIYAQFMRELMSRIGLLYITPGAFTLYKTSILKNVGGFDNTTLTEDFEIALRLKYKGYDILKNKEAITHTKVPTTFKSFIKQRLRWNLGFMENTRRYFWKFLKKRNFTLFGHIFYPLTLLSLFILSVYVIVKFYEWLTSTFTSIKIILYSKSVHFFETPLKEWLLSLDYSYILPLAVLIILSAATYRWALKDMKETIDHKGLFLIFFMFYSMLSTVLWIYSFFYAVFSKNRKWFR